MRRPTLRCLATALAVLLAACGSGASSSGGPPAGSHSISGTVSGLLRQGVTVALGGASAGRASTDAAGNYSFTGLADGTYTVTPAASGYAFSPTQLTVNVSGASVSGQDFQDGGAYSLSGAVTASGAGLAGATLTLNGTTTTTTDASGNYSFTGLAAGTYSVVPSLEGYGFLPVSRAVVIANGSSSGNGFAATPSTSPTYAISGSVTGPAASGVVVTLGGASSATTATDASGSFSFGGLAPGSYAVTPSLAGGYVFTPASLPAAVSAADVTGLDFAEAGAYAISGTVTLAGSGLPGVALSLDGTATATSTSSGSYSFGSLPDGTYVVTPSLAGYSFAPPSASVAVNGGNSTGNGFAASALPTYRLAGAVSGPAPGGVTVTLAGTSSAATSTDSSGNYSFAGLPAGSYTVTPSLAGYGFTPASSAVTLSGADVTGVNFTEGTRESWVAVYVDYANALASIGANPASFTHVCPTFYTVNYDYQSGVAYYSTCPTNGTFVCNGTGAGSNSFAGLTTGQFTAGVTALGLKTVPVVYGGAGNGGTDAGIQNILDNASGEGDAFIAAMTAEAVANGYAGYNLDWEVAALGSAYADKFVAFVNKFKAALGPGMSLSVDAIVSNVNGTWCSSNNGYLDFAKLAASSIDRVLIEDYVNALGTATTSCQGVVLSSTNPVGCDFTLTGELNMMCAPNLPVDKAIIGLEADPSATNAIAGAAFSAIESYGFTRVAVWPQAPFMNATGIEPAAATWYGLLENFLSR